MKGSPIILVSRERRNQVMAIQNIVLNKLQVLCVRYLPGAQLEVDNAQLLKLVYFLLIQGKCLYVKKLTRILNAPELAHIIYIPAIIVHETLPEIPVLVYNGFADLAVMRLLTGTIAETCLIYKNFYAFRPKPRQELLYDVVPVIEIWWQYKHVVK